MVNYHMEISNPTYPFFSKLIKFQRCIFEGIHWILTPSDAPTKIPYNRSTYVKVYYVMIESENGKVKSAHYYVQLVD